MIKLFSKKSCIIITNVCFIVHYYCVCVGICNKEPDRMELEEC